MSLRKQTPSDFLKQIIGRPVVVKLNSGVDYRGVLACLDGYMNIAIEQTEEYVNGQLKNKYGDAFLRGNNVRTGQRSPLIPLKQTGSGAGRGCCSGSALMYGARPALRPARRVL
uniref:U6 snRNA-associated Sm-like protein LSm6 n=1 Tax=Monopterus albus TaxID=43700 RepID=A0A3Q3Q303_MONAL